MADYVNEFGLKISPILYNFINEKAIPGTGVKPTDFWHGLAELIKEFSPVNQKLIERRKTLQDAIDAWHITNRDGPHDHKAYKAFLTEIGYLVDEGENFSIETENIDPEIAKIPGPQLVVPITNARYALNAANARWGSLYDCLYGTDAIGRPPNKAGYDKGHGARVVARSRVFLDSAFPIVGTSHADVRRYHIQDGQLLMDDCQLAQPDKFIGYKGNSKAPDSIVLRNNALHVELVFDRAHPIGSRDQALLADVQLESAISAIMDFEDSVACVDAEDKVKCYSNWLGLMKGDLEDTFEKNGELQTRNLKPDRFYIAPDGSTIRLKGRSLLWVRNVGHLMSNPAILDATGKEVPEGFIDAAITTLIGIHDLERDTGNSVTGSIYIVKPKMHGPEEVTFTNKLFDRVESILGLRRHTVKIGLMDEERRTSINLKECIRAAKHRVAFINTGFLDRTGDEIHTSMEAGPFSRKDFIKRKAWITGYENQNVDIGLECGLSGKAQIGKGMWAMPDMMAAMLEQKIAHPKSGANCAWVPSPTAATLHALHYHSVDVFEIQHKLRKGGRRAYVDTLLDIPVAAFQNWSPEQIMREVENNAQGILGYVVKWINQGIGCSKVLDINDVGLMEDRATCRISSQHIANWLHHGVINAQQVMSALRKMAAVVDRQNSGDPDYTPMAPSFSCIAFQAATDLVFKARNQPSGYTEPILHKRRLEIKLGV